VIVAPDDLSASRPGTGELTRLAAGVAGGSRWDESGRKWQRIAPDLCHL
jgi:hypothetical protein